MTILADYPAFTVLALPEGHNITFTEDKGYARTCPVAFHVRKLKRDRYNYTRSFTLGCDGDNAENVWAFGNGATLSAEPRAKQVVFGIEIGEIITIEGRQFKVTEAPNNNIALTYL